MPVSLFVHDLEHFDVHPRDGILECLARESGAGGLQFFTYPVNGLGWFIIQGNLDRSPDVLSIR